MTKTALVTGSMGFIGRHTVAELTRRGWYVETVDLKEPIWSMWAGDARRLFMNEDTRFNLVVHCAAHVGGRTDIDGKPTYVAAMNTQLDGALFEFALRTRPDHVIYWSSSAVYPVELQMSDEIPPLEEHDVSLDRPKLPDASYGWVKLTGEKMAEWARGEGLNVHVLRPFSGYGADQDTTYPFPRFVERAVNGDDPFDIWGTGEQVRDFVHVDDVVNCALAVVDQNYLEPLNVCTGVGTSFNRLARLVCNVAGYTPEFRRLPAAPTGVHRRVGDPTAMLRVYIPKISLEEGIKRAFA